MVRHTAHRLIGSNAEHNGPNGSAQLASLCLPGTYVSDNSPQAHTHVSVAVGNPGSGIDVQTVFSIVDLSGQSSLTRLVTIAFITLGGTVSLAGT